eukprot:946373-Prorocentrum_lima.AAC.1
MNLLTVVRKEAHMRRTLTRMGVEADEWFDAVTGRRREGLVLPYAPLQQPEEEDEVAVEPPSVPSAGEELVPPREAMADEEARAE